MIMEDSMWTYIMNASDLVIRNATDLKARWTDSEIDTYNDWLRES